MEAAIDAYQNYTELRPDNPLGHVELGFVYEVKCRREHSNLNLSQIEFNNAFCPNYIQGEAVRREWRSGGVNQYQLLTQGDKAFSRKQFITSAQWYQRGSLINNNLSNSTKFKWMIAAIISGEQPPIDYWKSVSIPIDDDFERIEGEDLLWMREAPSWGLNYGDRVSSHPGSDPNIGVMWWEGSAIAPLKINQSGLYVITIRAQNTPPAPIQLQIELNLTPIAQYELIKEDMSWQTLTTPAKLLPGYYILGINFTNDGTYNGINRNAYIDWVKVKHRY
jgi:hypothetical protein